MLQASLIVFLMTGSGQTPYNHATHFTRVPGSQACTTCHLAAGAADRHRPAATSHTSCNAEGCHAKTFYGGGSAQERADLCQVCHVAGSPGVAMDELHPFPRPDGARDSCVSFSHRAHLAPDRLGPAGCQTCHAIDPATKKTAVVSHDTCRSCHTPGKGAKPAMGDCAGCHPVQPADQPGAVCSPWKRNWRSIIFPHAPHRMDARKPGSVLNCSVCHTSVHRTVRVHDIELLQRGRVMKAVCGDCHVRRFAQKMPDGRTAFPLSKCGGCHRKKDARYQPAAGLPPGHGR